MGREDADYETLLELFWARVRTDPDREATRHLDAEERPVATTWSEWEQRARALAAGFVDLGLPIGGRVAILSRTRVEWAWLDVAVMMAGGISVPIFPNELPANCARLLRDSDARLVLAENPWQLKKLADILPTLDEPPRVVLIDERIELATGDVMTAAEFGLAARSLLTLDALRARGAARLRRDPGVLDERIEGVVPDACATICYTPGTEGQRKGVMLTHENLAAAAQGLAGALLLGRDDHQLIYLPIAQAYGRIALWTGVAAGATTAFARSLRHVYEDAARFEPTFFFAVPHLFAKTQAAIEAELRDIGGVGRVVAGWVLEPPPDGDASFFQRARREVARRIVKRKLVRRFGPRLRLAVSGSAPLPVETARFFNGHGLPIVECYGMVETCAATHADRPDDIVVGSVGRPLPGMEHRLLDDGELLVRGKNVAPGYWHDPEETRKVFDPDGWFHTGDLGRLDDAGRLVVTDRKRAIIVTATGKAIAPGPIAEKLRADSLVEQVLIHGDRRTFLSALISLDRAELARFAEDAGVEGDYESLSRHPAVYAHVEGLVDRVNATLAPHEAIRKFAILATELTPEAGDLTPTYRLKRAHAVDKHRALLDSFYSEQF